MTLLRPGYVASQQPWATEGRRRPVRWWLLISLLGVGIVLSVLWFLIEGVPFGDHSRYGSVSVPGSASVRLPAGDVRLFFQESDLGAEDSASPPDGLEVEITAPDGARVAVESIPSFLFSATTDGVGHVPHGRLDVPSTGEYTVRTDATGDLSDHDDPRVTFGEPPINPFGPPIVGALVVLAPFLVASAAVVAIRF